MTLERLPPFAGEIMTQSSAQDEIYQELRRRAEVEFGEERAAALEEYLQTTAGQIADVEQADCLADTEPMLQG